MKHKKSKRRYRIVLSIAVLVGLVSLDFFFTSNGVEEGTYRLESEFDGATGATATVAIVPSDYADLTSPVSRTVNPSYEQIEDMVRKAIELQGGLEWVVNKGDVVMIKVNLVGANSPSGQGENTDVRVVKALIKILADFTEKDVTIQVAEGTARTNDDPSTSGSVWENSGYTDLLTDSYLSGIDLSFVNLNQSIGDLIEVDLGDAGMSAVQGTKYHVHKAELEADVFIDVPVLKIHDTGITNALKLQVGTAPGCYYGYNKMAGTSYSSGIYHDINQRRWTSEMIVDLSAIAGIDFVVVDAIMTLESYKTYRGDNQVRMNTIIAGSDPVAIDHVCTRLFCLNPDDIAHITLAEKAGLGTNNPDQIVVTGAAIEDVRKKVDQNTSEYGKFGQSNRTWLLSQAYEGSDVKEDFITDEGTLRPEAGKEGWSEATYFFDDRIDLLSYYDPSTSIVSYAFTYFSSPEAKEAELWLGTHEGMEVYLNGEMVYSYYSTNAAFDDDYHGGKVGNINLLKGENALLVKTLQKYGDYSFTLNICDHSTSTIQSGNRVEGLVFYTKSTGTGSSVANKKLEADPVHIYPNPATELVHIVPGISSESASVMIYNMKGQLVTTLKSNEQIHAGEPLSWNLESNSGSRVQPGLYVCTVKSGAMVQSTRILVK